MHNIGIESISFYTPKYYLNLADLATARGFPAQQFSKSIGQEKMAIAAPGEDIVTMAANAGAAVLQDIDVNAIDTFFFATESSVDQSKAAGLFVHELLRLPSTMRVVELKQACYSATAAIQMALAYLLQNPLKKILLIAADVARYDLQSSGEASQGSAAVAMVLSNNPKIIAFESESGIHTESAMDFWRPNYRDTALVDGKASSKLYLNCLEKAWQRYVLNSGHEYVDHDYFCFHVPVARLAEKAFKHLLKVSGHGKDYTAQLLECQVDSSLYYSRQLGNCYSAALYLALCSLLDTSQDDLSDKRVGFYSYGSGCVAEYFSGIVQPGYQEYIKKVEHQVQLEQRQELSFEQYEQFYNYALPTDGSHVQLPEYQTGRFRLVNIENHKRNYAVVV